MKAKKNELDVDFIGGQESPLTPDEEKMLSDFFQQRKLIPKIGNKVKKARQPKRQQSVAK